MRAMFNRQVEPWAIFLVMSVLGHAAVLVTWGGRMGVQDASLENTEVSHILNIQLMKQQPMEKLRADLLPEPKPMPVVEEKRLKEIKPAEKSVEDSVAEPEPAPHKAEQMIEPQVQGEQLKNDHQLVIKQKQQYMQKLMVHIDAHKFYPAAARRRGI